MDNDEIERAKEAHGKVPDFADDLPIVLSRPMGKIHHKLPPQEGPKFIEPEQVNLLTHGAEAPRVSINPFYSDEDWFDGGDHELLLSIMQRGYYPNAFPEYSSPDNPPSYQKALSVAKKRGYAVPDTGLNPGVGEREAWHAAQLIARGHFRNYLNGVDWHWHEQIAQVTGQFIVPDPLLPGKWPWVTDQLWIVVCRERQLRLLALEIDEEVHLTPERRARDKRRDSQLGAVGYEVFRVAAWWCLVDPFRTVCEFLAAADLLPDPQDHLVAGELASIKDYTCKICGQPMVRWDMDWIQPVHLPDGETIHVHRGCVSDSDEF